MHIKSYFAASIQAAIEQARRELGPDALIMNSREAPPEARHAGAYEVVFAVNHISDPVPAVQPQPAREAKNAPPAHDSFHRELGDLRKQIMDLRACIRGEALPTGLSATLSEIQAHLVERGLSQNLTEAIATSLRSKCGTAVTDIRIARTGPKPNSAALWELLPGELEARLRVDSELPSNKPEAHAIALVGPPGVGKTTTLVKLALTSGLRSCRPIQLLSLDTVRIAAVEQLRSYAAILGVGFQALETAYALKQALEEHRHKGLILIDTAGYSRNGLADAHDLARFLAGNPGIDTHLVLPASMRQSDLERMAESFAIFKPSRLIFTKLDETDSFGSIYSVAARTGLPVSFLASGQSVPEDIEPAVKGKMVDMILPDQCRRAESVA